MGRLEAQEDSNSLRNIKFQHLLEEYLVNADLLLDIIQPYLWMKNANVTLK